MLVEPLAFVTKVLLPQRRADVLRRPRLVDFLHQHIDRRLVLVCAPAGYGKTTLIVDFTHDVGIPVCWYALGPADTDIRVFLEYFIAAIRQKFPDFGHRTEALLRSGVDINRELSAIVGALVSEMHATIQEYFIVVLDDFHAVDGSEQINSALDLLLYYLPENCHIVLSSRSIPHLTLSRLAAHRQVAGLGTSDLRFTSDEIKQLLSENYKVLLPAKTAQELATESEGWIAGIILSTHTLWQGLMASIIRAKGAGGEVFDYLASEVFTQQPEDVQRFLLATSVLEQLSPNTCSDLLEDEDAESRLQYLEESNLFVTRLAGPEIWYRYHQLFRAFLETRLQDTQPEWYLSLQGRAATLAVERGAWEEAITHHGKAGDHEAAAKIICDKADEMIDAGKLPTLSRWIDSLPAGILASQAQLLLIRGRLYARAGEHDRGLELLNQACGHFAAAGDRLNTARALATRAIALAVKAHHTEAIEDCQRALSLIGETNALATAEAYRNLGICHGMRGQFAEAIAALDEALRFHSKSGNVQGIATLHQSLGSANAKLGNVPKARFHFEEALALWRRLGNAGSWGETLNCLGILLHDDGEYDAALATLGDALAKAREGNYLRIEAAVLANIADVHRVRERFDEAAEHYERSLEIARRIAEGYLVGSALNGLGDVYARMGDQKRADRFIRQALAQAEERQSGYERGMYETSLGMLRCDQGQAPKALRSLSRACDLLRQSGAKQELTRALLGRARALHLTGHLDQALSEFTTALDIAREIDYEHFLVVEGKRCLPLLRDAQKHGIEDERLDAAIAKLCEGGEQPRRPRPVAPLQRVASPQLPKLEALALGQASVLRDGKEITRSGWASDKVRELFFFLVSHTHGLRKEQIVECLWPDLPPGSYNSTFHSTMYRLRRALQGEYILQREGHYRLSPDLECYYDVGEFERLVDEADRLPLDSKEAEGLYRQALAIYQGPYLKEFESEWCEIRRRQLADRQLSALDRLAAIFASERRYGESIDLCGQVVAIDNFREETHYLLLQCYVAIGDRVTALRHYRHYVTFLRDELGVAPSPKIRAIYDEVLRGERAPATQR